ncbi:hypothetical protein STRTUCAR8_08211 [Streptomyces turgidiscabies Car8]|uniref:Uncharacterized protein n=1 Tax=Streptomyces turgidiscabies (strain Car8) TaxID=698760 RepID=L7FD13_STRT8|nr:hypothetical protein STRTUCAR8_08211 [Streptomyces turgidiscabies Car8]
MCLSSIPRPVREPLFAGPSASLVVMWTIFGRLAYRQGDEMAEREEEGYRT